jgi:ketosteroid isomerase-like protein
VEEFVRLSHRILDAIVHRDAATLDALFDDEFVAFAPAGGRQRKQEFIDAVVDAPFHILDASFESLEVEVVDDRTAVVVGIQRAEVRLPTGEHVVSRGAFTDLFVRRGQEWRVRVVQSVDLPNPI